jgi:hypothetical protein
METSLEERRIRMIGADPGIGCSFAQAGTVHGG